jgi:hypothetical protein
VSLARFRDAQVRFSETADGVAEPEGVGGVEVGEGERTLLDVGLGFEEVAAEDAGEDSRGEGRGEELPCSLDEEIADGALGELVALVEEDHFVEAFGADSG